MVGGLKGSFSRKGVIAGRAVGWLVVMGNGWSAPATGALLLWIWVSERGVPQHDILRRTCVCCVQALYAVGREARCFTGADGDGKRGGWDSEGRESSVGRVHPPNCTASCDVFERTSAKTPHLRYNHAPPCHSSRVF